MSYTDEQREDALQTANSKRRQLSTLKQRVKDGTLTVGQVVISPPPAVEVVRLADVITWPWPKLGPSRQMRIGKLAAREGINVLLPVGKASRQTRVAFTTIVCDVLDAPSEWSSKVCEDQTRDDDVDRLNWLLKRAEEERDRAVDTIAELERTMSVHQVVMPALDAERMVADLADAVEVHRRTVTSPKSPPEKWANADEELWRTKDLILTGETPRLRAVA